MGRKTKKKGGKKASSKNGGNNAPEQGSKNGSGKEGDDEAAAAQEPKNARDMVAKLKSDVDELITKMMSVEENRKSVTDDELTVAHLLNAMNILTIAELGGEMDEEKHESVIFCEENASNISGDGGADFRRRFDVAAKKKREMKMKLAALKDREGKLMEFVESDTAFQEMKKKGDREGCMRIIQERVRSEGDEEHLGFLFKGTSADDTLFAPPPPKPECPICMLTLPGSGRVTYQPCCGKMLCDGCIFAHRDASIGREFVCPFCRNPQNEDRVKLTRKRAEGNSPEAIFMLASHYVTGSYGVPMDHGKAIELFQRSADLGFPAANHTLGVAYDRGVLGLDKDAIKATHHLRLSAIGGEAESRFLLGIMALESQPQDVKLATKHLIIAAEAGHEGSLNTLKLCYKEGCLSKEAFAKALRANQAAKDGVRSEQRDRAWESRDRSEDEAAEKILRGKGGQE